MTSSEQVNEQVVIDRRATEIADRGGARPKLEALTIGIFTAVGVFGLLDIFAAVVLPDRNAAFWPVVIITALSASGAAAIQRWREKAWLSRYTKAVFSIHV
jgi:hypothetical protein